MGKGDSRNVWRRREYGGGENVAAARRGDGHDCDDELLVLRFIESFDSLANRIIMLLLCT